MCYKSINGAVGVSHLDWRHLSESFQAILESAGSKGKHFYIIFRGGRGHNLNAMPFGGSGIYNGSIIYVRESKQCDACTHSK